MKTIFIPCFLLFALNLCCQWNSLKGPYGGWIYGYLNVDKSCYVSTTNGLFRTDNSGQNWTRLGENLPEYYVLSQFCADSNEVFLSYQDYKTNEYGFAYSNDKGSHWLRRKLPNPDWHASGMSCSNGIVLADFDYKLMESDDKGVSWTESNFPIAYSYINFIKSNHLYFFVGIGGKLYRRSSKDTSWSLILNSPVWISTLHVSDSLIFILNDRQPGLRSIDNGNSWQSNNINGFNGVQMIAEFGDTIYYDDLQNIMRSTDRGLTWTAVAKDLNGAFRFDEVLRVGSSLMANPSAVGLLKTNDEFTSFESSYYGMYGGKSGGLFSTDSFLFVLSAASLERYDLLNKTWNSKSNFLEKYLEDFLYSDGIIYILTSNDEHIYKSKDDGLTFEIKDPDLFSGNILSKKILKLKDKLILPRSSFSKYSSDFGESWNDLNIKDWVTNQKINSVLDMCIYDEQAFLATKDNSGKYVFYKSSDLIVWEKSIPIFPVSNPDFVFKGFVTTNEELFIKTSIGNFCNLWKYDTLINEFVVCKGLSGECDPIFDFKVKILTHGDKRIFLNFDGYYYSEDKGLNWIRIIDEFGYNRVPTFWDMESTKGKIYAANSSIGILELDWDSIKAAPVQGLVYYDENENQVYDGSDLPIQNAFVELKRTSQYVRTNGQGHFQFLYSTALKDTLIPKLYSKHGTFYPDKLEFAPGDTGLNFGFRIPNQIDDLTLQMVGMPRARPGFKYYLDISLKNQGALPCSGQIQLNYDPQFIYQKATVAPGIITSSFLSWNFKDLLTLNEQKIRVEFSIPVNVVVNSTFQHVVNLQNLSCNDIDLTDNEVFIKDSIVASCDPNEMLVNKNQISKTELDNKIPLTYTIRFQNTGNHEAEFVKLKTYIANYDLSKFSIQSASHPFSFQIKEDGYLEVLFDMIHLPDSLSDESKSHGYFSYTISPVKEHVFGDLISAYTQIYFDYNKAIQTNQAITKVVKVVGSKDFNKKSKPLLIVEPNPSLGEFKIYSPDHDINEMTSIRIYNLQGRSVYSTQEKIYDGYKLDLKGVNPGIYFLKIGISNPVIGKIIIQN